MNKEQGSIPGETQQTWKTRIDELATTLMIEGGSPATVGALQAIGLEMKEKASSASLLLLNGLVDKLKADLESGTDYLLQHGLAELHASVDASEKDDPGISITLSEDAELVADFLVEAREHLSQIESQMLALEKDPHEMEVIHAVFRAFHTIKGLAGFLDFGRVQALAHEVETLLDLARNAKLTIDSAIVDVVLESADALRADLTAIEHALTQSAPVHLTDKQVLQEKIRSLTVPREATAVVPETVVLPPVQHVTPVVTSPAPVEAPSEAELLEQIAKLSTGPQPAVLPTPVLVPTPVVVPTPPAAPAAVKAEASPLPEVTKPREQTPAKEPTRSADASSVRVETSKLDHLMDMVGEIVIAQSLIRHNPVFASTTDTRLLGDLSQLARVTVEVQRATMSMRMVPVGQLFQRIERVIRDLSRKAGKQVILETSGTETEIDKTVAEELSDPLLHMVRNSVDHGIERVEERIAAGKSPEAKIRLSAHHQGGQVIIQISDDGRGLNSEKIRAKAEEKHLISASTQLTETEVFQLIFEPGFSTAEKITDVSGRGVGMDVVRRNVEKLRGRIETQSTLGQGTTFLLKLPLTLAIIDGLVVEVGTQRYIIPLACVREIFRPQPESLFTAQGRDEMILVRGKLSPVVRLHERLGITGRSCKPSDGLMVVVESEGKQFCLLVDDLLGKQEVVIKSLGETFKYVSGLSGCAVLGDGTVGLILDVDGIYRGKRA